MGPPQREDNDRTQRHRQMECSQRKTDESFWNVFKHSLQFYHTSPDWTPPFRSPLFIPWPFFSVWPFSWLVSVFLFRFMACDFPLQASSSLFFLFWCQSHTSSAAFTVLFFFFKFCWLCTFLFENGKFILSFQCRVGLHLSRAHDILLYSFPSARPHHTLHL